MNCGKCANPIQVGDDVLEVRRVTAAVLDERGRPVIVTDRQQPARIYVHASCERSS